MPELVNVVPGSPEWLAARATGVPECMENVDFGEAGLMCWLPRDHAGLHYDAARNISWKEGAPGGIR